MYHFKLCHDLILVTNATKQTVEKAIELLKSKDNYERDISDVADILNHLGYSVSWDNYQDLEVIDF